MTMTNFNPPDLYKVSREEKIKALLVLKKENPDKAEMIDELIKRYKKGEINEI